MFWRPLRMLFLQRPLVIQVAYMLHNMDQARDTMPISVLGQGAGVCQTSAPETAGQSGFVPARGGTGQRCVSA